jgi:hypothetical protein
MKSKQADKVTVVVNRLVRVETQESVEVCVKTRGGKLLALVDVDMDNPRDRPEIIVL